MKDIKFPTDNGKTMGALKDIKKGDVIEAASAVGQFIKAFKKIITDLNK